MYHVSKMFLSHDMNLMKRRFSLICGCLFFSCYTVTMHDCTVGLY